MNKIKKAFPILLMLSVAVFVSPIKNANYAKNNDSQITLTEYKFAKTFYLSSQATNFVNIVNNFSEINRNTYKEVSSSANEALTIYNGLSSEEKSLEEVINAKTKLDNALELVLEYEHVEEFIDSLHMDENTEGQCYGYYGDAKTSYSSLSSSERALFHSGEYTEEWSRFHSWIIANGEEFIGGMISSSGSNLSLGKGVYKDNLEIVALFLIAAAAVSLLTTILVLVKKRKR